MENNIYTRYANKDKIERLYRDKERLEQFLNVETADNKIKQLEKCIEKK